MKNFDVIGPDGKKVGLGDKLDPTSDYNEDRRKAKNKAHHDVKEKTGKGLFGSIFEGMGRHAGLGGAGFLAGILLTFAYKMVNGIGGGYDQFFKPLSGVFLGEGKALYQKVVDAVPGAKTTEAALKGSGDLLASLEKTDIVQSVEGGVMTGAGVVIGGAKNVYRKGLAADEKTANTINGAVHSATKFIDGEKPTANDIIAKMRHDMEEMQKKRGIKPDPTPAPGSPKGNPPLNNNDQQPGVPTPTPTGP